MKKFKATKKGEQSKKEAASRKGRNSRAKGASFERKLADFFTTLTGFEFVRTPQSGGFAKNKASAEGFRGDVVPADRNVNFALHVEAKCAKTWSFPKWIAQAEADVPKGKIPVVIAHKFGTSKMYILIDLDDLPKIVSADRLAARKAGDGQC